MKRLRKQHVLEQSIYGAIWIVIFLLPLIGGYFAMSGGLEREETRMVIRESWLSILPFFVLFLLNNYGLVPYFLFKKRYWQYTVSLIFVIGMICWLSPFPSANHFPKDFKRGELPLRMKENRRDQIIKTREKAREEGDVFGSKGTMGRELPYQGMCIGMNPIPNNVLGEWEIQMVPEDFQNRLLFLILLLCSAILFISSLPF